MIDQHVKCQKILIANDPIFANIEMDAFGFGEDVDLNQLLEMLKSDDDPFIIHG